MQADNYTIFSRYKSPIAVRQQTVISNLLIPDYQGDMT